MKEYQNFLKTFNQHPLPNPEKFFDVPGATPDTYGGNTSCVEVRFGNQIFVLDMGTGLRPLGNSLISEMFKNYGRSVTFLISHVHWDHIHGLPFFAPLYINKNMGIKNSWRFFGGTDWQKTAEICLRGQMDPPTFPVSWSEIEKTTHEIGYAGMVDLMKMDEGDAVIQFGKLNHPQETYGTRLTLP